MWSNISAPKSGLKAAQVGQQVKHDSTLDQQENNRELSNPYSGKTSDDSPLMRYKHAVCSSPSGFIYIHGGRFANGVPLDDDVWRFDPHENRWLQLKTSGCKPPSLQEHTLSEYQEQLYLFGGQVSAASGQENFFWRLDLAKCQWTSLNMDASNCSSLKYGVRLGPTNRRGHSACIYKDSIYIFGGYEDFRGSTNQLWQYDLLNERWELRNLSSSSACHPEPRHNHSAIIYQDSMYIYGGLSNLKSLGDLWRWSWKEKRWFRERTRGQSPGQLHGHTAIQAFGSMFVFGGERQNGRTTRSLWRLNLSNLCWQKIKPKGPRPNPTTWHAAIANPLGILDEANYLVEGDASDLEAEQQQQEQQLQLHLHEHQQDDLMVVINHQQQQQSSSDNCFSTSMQQTIPMETIRPVMLNSAHNQQRSAGPELQQRAQRALVSNSNHQQRAASRLKVSKSTSEQMSCLAKQAASQSRDRVTKTKRRLRLNFLKRNKAKKSGETKTIPTSWSAASILDTNVVGSRQSQQSKQPGDIASKRHSVAVPANEQESANDIEMLNLDLGHEQPETGAQVADTSASILDSLDTDIKCMFQRALSPTDEDQHESAGLAQDRTEANVRDSMTQSQLSSCMAPTTTQTYQTARDHLSSPSTLTITSPAEGQHKQSGTLVSANKLADIRQRKSVHQFNQARGRPKSEIVQSLIDRADARIKHLYTPYFNPEANHRDRPAGQQQQGPNQQQRRAGFNSNESVLGELANHRMFDRSETTNRRTVALDKSKRHTIHQTMTYYNLYFAEDRRLDGSSGGDSSSSPPATSGDHQEDGRRTDGAEIAANGAPSNGTNDKSLVANNQTSNSTSAALVGVHDGTTSSSGGDSSQRTLFLSRLESEVGSLMHSSDSRTLCADLNNDFQRQPQSHYHFGAEMDKPNGFDSRHRVSEFGVGDEMNNTADNTSLSFSAIAEFEEDDMLQYSSPTDLVMDDNQADGGNDDEFDHDDNDDDDDCEEGRVMREEADDRQGEGEEPRRQLYGSEKRQEEHSKVQQVMQPQKSTSSGYDSIRSAQSSSGNSRGGYQQQSQQQQPQAHQQQGHETSSYSASSNGGSPRNTGSSPRQQQQQHEQHFRSDRPTMVIKRETVNTTVTTASSTTAESLALTTNDTNTSDSCPLTPPSKSLPSSPPDLSQVSSVNASGRQHSPSFAASLMSGPSRLFGRKRTTKTRYWQLCMFVIGGKQHGGHHNAGNLNEPIAIWRLYI